MQDLFHEGVGSWAVRVRHTGGGGSSSMQDLVHKGLGSWAIRVRPAC